MKNQVKFILIVFLILHSNNLMAQSNFSKVWVCGTGSRKVVFDNSGNAIQNENNPYALTFDPSYVFASNQGFRFFFGLRYKIP